MKKQAYTLRISAGMMNDLNSHLFPGDHDEHGAVIGAAIVETEEGTRFLARKLFLAKDGEDYIPGKYGYRMLTPDFVRNTVRECEADGLAYFAVHCHGGTYEVGFSNDDMASHERGYPALLDILDGRTVGGLVFSSNAVAGDIWLSKSRRVSLDCLEIISYPVKHLYPSPPRQASYNREQYDRQIRLFGEHGQAILRNQKVAVIGAGGAGSLLVEYLSRLGVGEILVIDDDRIDNTNLPRVVGSKLSDLVTKPSLLSRLFSVFRDNKKPALKVDIAKRVALDANPNLTFSAIASNIADQGVAVQLADCDYIFLAADSMQARLIFNALVHQYLIPGTQVGAKVTASSAGNIQDAFSVVRPLIPGYGCLWCNELISSSRLQEEATQSSQFAYNKYVDEPEIVSPSVITLNAVAVAHATDDYLFNTTGLLETKPLYWTKYRSADGTTVQEVPRGDLECYECTRRLGAGSLLQLPVKSN